MHTTLNEHILYGKKAMNWINHVKEALIDKRGTLNAGPISLTWEGIKATNPLLNDRIKEVSDKLIATYTAMELEFARQHPTAVSQQHFLKSLAPLFEQEKVDWREAETQLIAVLDKFFKETDFSSFSQPDDLCLLVTAKNHEKTLGMIQFLITPQYEYGTVKVGLYTADKGTEKLLMDSVLTFLPETSRIFLHTRVTNESTLDLYRSWGFTTFEGPLPYWTDLEYLVEEDTV